MGQIINDDCRAGLTKIPDNSVDFVITDPPFNVGLDYGETTNDRVSDSKYMEWCYEWINELYRVLKDGRYAIIFTGDAKMFVVADAIRKTLFMYHHMLKWIKPNCQRALSGTVFFSKTELAFVLSKNKPDIGTINRRELFSDSITFNNETPRSGEKQNINHPAQRPVGLYKKIICGFTNVGDMVLDCFSGSGTTAVVCEQTKRDYIVFEINKTYCELAERRVREYRTNEPEVVCDGKMVKQLSMF